MKRISAVAAVFVVISAAVPTHADAVHDHNLRFGQLAMGMGGAVTAHTGSPEATLYNPGALAFLDAQLVSGSIQFYGFERLTLGRGFVVPGLAEADLSSDELVVLPASSVASVSFGASRHVLALSTFNVAETSESFFASADAEVLGDPTRETFVSHSLDRQDRILYTGPSYAFVVHEGLGLGVSVFYVHRETTTAVSTRLAEDQFAADGSQLRTVFGGIASRADVEDGALVVRLGTFWEPTADLAFGATASGPSLRLHGSADLAYSFEFSGDPDVPGFANPTQETLGRSGRRARSIYPPGASVGARWTVMPTLRLTLDVTAALPVSYQRIDLSDNERSLFANSFVNDVERELLINTAAGMEWFVAPRWPLRFGLFTNRSAAPAIAATSDRLLAADVDRFGATASVGYRGPRAGLNIGVEVQGGTGDDVVLTDASRVWSPDFTRVQRRELRAVVFVTGALNFARTEAKEMLDDTKPDSTGHPEPRD